jgi:putative MATE family efflux protein
MWLAIGIGAVLAVVGSVLADPLVRLFGASSASAPYAVTYLRVSSLGEPAMLLVLAATGVLRGLQNTRTPLVVAAIGAAANVVLNYVLVYPVGMGIAGSATGTVLAQLGMAAAYTTVVVRAAKRHQAPLRPDVPGIKLAATSSVPLLIRTMALRLALLAGTVIAARYGTEALAAHQVAWALWSFLALAMDALAIAGQASISKLLGAGDVAGARAATRRSVEWGVMAGVGLGIVVLLARQFYIPLFTDDPEVRHLLGGVLVLVAAFQVLSGPVFVLDGILIGAGDGRYLALAGLVTTAAYLAAALTSYALHGGLIGLWWATGIFMLARLIALAGRIRTPNWMVVGVQ